MASYGNLQKLPLRYGVPIVNRVAAPSIIKLPYIVPSIYSGSESRTVSNTLKYEFYYKSRSTVRVRRIYADVENNAKR